MIAIRVYGSDLKKLRADLDWSEKSLRRLTMDSTKATAGYTSRRMKKYAPGVASSGALRDSIIVRSGGRSVWDISVGEGLDKPYHIYQEFGYTPHRVPRKYLHTPTPDESREGVAMVSKSTPYIAPALVDAGKYLHSRLVNDIANSFSKFRTG